MKRKKFFPTVLLVFSGVFLALGVFFFWRDRAEKHSSAAAVMEKDADADSDGQRWSETSPGSEDYILTEEIFAEDISAESAEENIVKEINDFQDSGQNTETEQEQNQGEDEEVSVSSVEIPVRELAEHPYKNYFLQNSDMTAWLKIPDTIIDYPVMWTPEDEEYYLLRGFDKKDSSKGCLILDTDSSMEPLTTNLIIHGHNYRGAMFGELDKYEKESYRDEHPYIYLYGRDYEHIYEVMAVFRSKVYYTTDVCFKYYKFFQADTEEEFEDFYGNVKSLAEYETGVEASFGDRFITLSTCAYHTENGRLVVVGKEIEPGEFYQSFDNTEK